MNNNHRRGGYTLIELLIVLGIIALLAGLTIAFMPNAASNARESRAAVNLQGWLNIAKQRALRDQAPRGLRLWVTTATFGNTPISNVVTECQYLEQPDDFTGGMIRNGLPAPPPASGYNPQATIEMTVDPTNAYGVANLNNYLDPNMKYWSVQPGDYLEILGSGLMHQVIQVGVPDNNGNIYKNYLVVSPPLLNPLLTPTPNYRILRSPRPVGDETLKMPDGTVIDLQTNIDFGSPLPPADPTSGFGFVDIVFAPSGQVISRGVTGANIHLWVRAPDPNNMTAPGSYYRGAPTIVSVFVRTGFVGAYAPAVLPNPPYGNVF